ncbi:head GIN domain-containing protein [Mucilaginibacter litoreus]|uniref:Head GIN domain-containing protein n=1 Tax=Mucilaginibacter litoreus TaxID=1048221 RepID=A0ABW3AN16_9SPHI
MKKHHINIILVIAIASVTVLTSCRRFRCKKGSGDIKSETHKVGDFTKLDIAGGFKVTLKQDSSQNVVITADDNLLQYILTDVNGGTLRIKNKRNICGSREITLVIGVRNLNEIEASGGIELKTDGRLNVKDLHFDLSGATKVDMDLSAANVSTEGSGATEIALRGQAASHDLHLSGSGKVNALDFVVGRYNIETSGASECKVNVLNELSVHTTGASDIQYRGNPGTVNSEKTGASTLKKID